MSPLARIRSAEPTASSAGTKAGRGRKKKTKRGFKTKKATMAWEVDFFRQMEGMPDMILDTFY